jgi:hypothetical protein
MMEGASVEVVSRLLRRGIVLERFTIAWNVIEAGVAVAAGIIAGSDSIPALRSLPPCWFFCGSAPDLSTVNPMR